MTSRVELKRNHQLRIRIHLEPGDEPTVVGVDPVEQPEVIVAQIEQHQRVLDPGPRVQCTPVVGVSVGQLESSRNPSLERFREMNLAAGEIIAEGGVDVGGRLDELDERAVRNQNVSKPGESPFQPLVSCLGQSLQTVSPAAIRQTDIRLILLAAAVSVLLIARPLYEFAQDQTDKGDETATDSSG